MEYGLRVLSTFFELIGRRTRTKRFVDAVTCAFCCGTGVDLKYGNMSRCSVCGATGKVTVTPPVVTCRRCSGSGRESGDLSCLVCKGAGVVSVRKEATTCAKCFGTGEDGVFYCSPCKGQGLV